MASRPVSREELVALIGEVDDSFYDRILRTEATIGEIAEAITDIEGRSIQPYVPSSRRVAIVRGILEDLRRPDADPHTVEISGGTALVRPVNTQK